MHRKFFISLAVGAAVFLGSPHAGWSQGLSDVLIVELRKQGYDEIKTRRTLLGRVRITAESDGFYREIVINPSTGVILRDYLRRKVQVGDHVEYRDPYDDGDDDEGSDDGSSESGSDNSGGGDQDDEPGDDSENDQDGDDPEDEPDDDPDDDSDDSEGSDDDQS